MDHMMWHGDSGACMGGWVDGWAGGRERGENRTRKTMSKSLHLDQWRVARREPVRNDLGELAGAERHRRGAVHLNRSVGKPGCKVQ